MIIGFVSPYPPKECGIAEYTYFLTNALKKVKPDIEIVVFAENVSQETTGIQVVESFKRWDVDYNKLLNDIKQHGPFDVIHIEFSYWLFPYEKGFIKFLEKVRELARGVIVTLHEVFRAEDKKKVEAQRAVVDLATYVIVHSPLQEYELIAQTGKPEKIIRIPHGTKLFNPISRKRALSLLGIEGLDIPDDYKVIAITGFIRRDKGIEYLIDAVKKILKENPNIFLLIAGLAVDSEYYKFLTNKIKEDLPKNAVIINRFLSRTELNLVISLSDVIVLPYVDPWDHYSISGIFHYVIGSGKPVLCSKSHRLVECNLIAPNLTFLPNNVDDLYFKLNELLKVLDNEEEKEKLFENLWNYAKNTRWEAVALRHLTIYKYLEKTPEGQEKMKEELNKAISPEPINIEENMKQFFNNNEQK